MLPRALLQGPAGAGLHNWPLELCCTALEREERSREQLWSGATGQPSRRRAAVLSMQADGSVWDGKVVPWQGWWSSKELSRRLN